MKKFDKEALYSFLLKLELVFNRVTKIINFHSVLKMSSRSAGTIFNFAIKTFAIDNTNCFHNQLVRHHINYDTWLCIYLSVN